MSKWRRRFVARRLDGHHDELWPVVPRSITDADVERAIVMTLEAIPAGATHWSTRSTAQATGMSQTGVSGICRAFGLKPHLRECFKLSPDPLFIEKVWDTAALPEPARGSPRAARGLNVVERWFGELTVKWLRRAPTDRRRS